MIEVQVLPLEGIAATDVSRVGGKNASLGEMIAKLGPAGVQVPPGFATTAAAFRLFLRSNGLEPAISSRLAEYHAGRLSLPQAAAAIREAILAGRIGSVPIEWRSEPRRTSWCFCMTTRDRKRACRPRSS